jgi:hypothetical protein
MAQTTTTSDVGVQKKIDASTLFQTSSQALVLAAALVYLFGFIIVSIFDASYGIADFSFFRTKVVAVGTLFVFLCALAMLLTFRMFHFFGLEFQVSNPFPLVVTSQNRGFIIADVALSIPFACVGLMVLLAFLFTKFPWVGKGYLLFLVTGAVALALSFLGRKWLNSHPFLFVSLSALNTAALLLILFFYNERSSFWFVVWLSLVCVFTLQLSLRFRKAEEVRKTEWERFAVTILVAIFGLYATKVFPNIKHEFGGAPVPIVLHLTKKLPVFDSESASVSLIDETEQGYYVARGSDKAVFVARGLVEEVEFLRNDGNVKP